MELSKQDLKKIEWLLKKEKTGSNKDTKNYSPDYEDVTKFNTERTILDYVGKKTLETLLADIMDLLDTSIAVYEKNGDYAYGQFDSAWCQLMDNSSFKLCKTSDTKKALTCGEWLCHENCWNDSAKQAIITRKPTDIECVGGIHLYGEPIKANGKVIGCINIGYGNPPQDEKTLAELAEKYQINKEEILKRSKEYKPRPPFIIENAKKRLKSIALLIGQLVENSITNAKLQKSEELLITTGSMAKVGGWELNLETKKVKWTKETTKIHEVPEDYTPSFDEAVTFYPGEAKEKITNFVNKALTEGIAFDTILPFITAKGRKKWVQAMGNPVFKDGKCIRLHGTFQDITEAYEAELKLKERESLLKRTEEIANVGSWDWDIATDTVTWSDELFKIFGRDPNKGAVSYAEHPKVYTAESMKILDEAVQNTIKTGESYDIDVDIVRKGGAIRHCIAKGYAQKNNKGKIVKLYGSFQDITKRKQNEHKIKALNEELAAQNEEYESINEELQQTISELEVTKDTIQESEERFRNVIDSSPFPLAIADTKDQHILYWSKSAIKQFGHQPDKVEEWYKLAYPDPEYRKEVIKRWQPFVEQVVKSDKPINTGEYQITCKNGSVITCEIYANFIPGYMIVTMNDITEKKKNELIIKEVNEELAAQNEEYENLNEELQQTVTEVEKAKEAVEESEERFKALHNASFGGITIHDKGVILECNQGLSDITGYSYEELIGMDGLSLIAEEMRNEVMNHILSEYEKPYEVIGQRKNGEKYPLRLEARMIPYKGKKVRAVEFRDITEITKILRKLENNKNEIETWIQNTPICTKKIDLDFNIQFMSESGIKDLKIENVHDFYGKHYPFYFFPEDFKVKMASKLREVKEKGELIQFDGILSDIKGNRIWYNHNLVPVRDSENKIDYILVVSMNISDRKKAEKQLIHAKHKAEESDRLKSAFLANMSHEIRTPMNGILGFTDLLKKPGLKGEKQQKYINVIQMSGKRMLETINDIIEISKIEAGDIQPAYEKININEQLAYYYDFFKPEVNDKGMELSVNKTLEDDKAIVITDTSMFNSILTNLIKNAIKYSDEGSIDFGYTLHKKNELKFYVMDTGIGISKEKFEIIFDRFMQADIGDTRAAQGSGLGLSICKAYIQILGGRIWLDSEKNKGTTFFFTLPYSQQKKE